MSRHAVSLAATLALVAGLALPVAAAAPAAAADPCAPSFGENYDPANPADPSIYVVETAVDAPAFVNLWGMCFPTPPTLTIVSNPSGAGVALESGGVDPSGFTVSPPSGFTGLLEIEATVAFASDTRDYTLYVYVGVPGASFPILSNAPQVGTVGVPVVYDLSGLTFPGGAPGSMVVLNSSGQFSVSFDASVPSFSVTPLQNVGGPFQARVLIGDGIQAKEYRVVLWVGTPIPDRVIWGPQPAPVQIEPLGTGYFTLTNYAPHGSECEIKITTDPDVEIVASPPSMNGLPSVIPIRVTEDFVGLLTVHYVLACKAEGGAARDFLMLLYVGIPMPTLAATGTAPAPVLIVGGLLLAVGLGLARPRRTRTR